MKTELIDMYKDKVVLITGGLGSIGSEILKKFREFEIKRIIVLDNRETEMFHSNLDLSDARVEFEFADVKDYRKLEILFQNVDIVFHAAAMKHVTICEENPYDAITTNVIGTKNVIDACIINNIQKMIYVSTDKSVNPTNVMGATKLLGEKLIGAVVTSQKNRNTKFGVIRFGNVLYSRGSVLEIWNKQLNEGDNITITDEKMTRFFMNIPQCVDLMLLASYYSKVGEIFIIKMPSIKIKDLAEVYLELKNVAKNNIKLIGKRKGEKMHEELILKSDDGIILENKEFIVKFPSFVDDDRINEIINEGFKKSNINMFSSSNSEFILTKKKIKNYLIKEKDLLQN